jgi:hypothetical protein
MPFGGPSFMLEFVTDGIYGEKVFNIYNIPYDNLYAIWINRFIGLVFWTSIFINIALLFFSKINIKTKGKISLISLIILLLIIFAPKMF